MQIVRFCAAVLGVVLAIDTLSGKQQADVRSEVRDGQQLFLANCAVCHGPDGDSVPGVDLGHGKFKRASFDDSLVEIIQAGVTGTAMPAFSKDLSP
ncbi:MAG TPA: c-type cytochrome, partial [Candidatus Dormibacteraeota bacterium]|nr:c-type cytochrome [Candidatus Dormibacteraeota bacterium]